ncbi:MAG: hypothetical protein J5819_03525, partial [Eubacterium sp.]|nr:hypothetical protein [Eubacterium sp.]
QASYYKSSGGYSLVIRYDEEECRYDVYVESTDDVGYRMMLSDLRKIHAQLICPVNSVLSVAEKWTGTYEKYEEHVRFIEKLMPRVINDAATDLVAREVKLPYRKVRRNTSKTMQDYFSGKSKLRTSVREVSYDIYEHRMMKQHLCDLRKNVEYASNQDKGDFDAELETYKKKHRANSREDLIRKLDDEISDIRRNVWERKKEINTRVNECFGTEQDDLREYTNKKDLLLIVSADPRNWMTYSDNETCVKFLNSINNDEKERAKKYVPFCVYDLATYKTSFIHSFSVKYEESLGVYIGFFYKCIEEIGQYYAKIRQQFDDSVYVKLKLCMDESTDFCYIPDDNTTNEDNKNTFGEIKIDSENGIYLEGIELLHGKNPDNNSEWYSLSFKEYYENYMTSDREKYGVRLEMRNRLLNCYEEYHDLKFYYRLKKSVKKRNYNRWDELKRRIDRLIDSDFFCGISPCQEKLRATNLFLSRAAYRDFFLAMKQDDSDFQEMKYIEDCEKRSPVGNLSDIYEVWCLIRILYVFIDTYSCRFVRVIRYHVKDDNSDTDENVPENIFDEKKESLGRKGISGPRNTLTKIIRDVFNSAKNKNKSGLSGCSFVLKNDEMKGFKVRIDYDRHVDDTSRGLSPDFLFEITYDGITKIFIMDAKYRNYADREAGRKGMGAKTWLEDVFDVAWKKYIDDLNRRYNVDASGSFIIHSDNQCGHIDEIQCEYADDIKEYYDEYNNQNERIYYNYPSMRRYFGVGAEVLARYMIKTLNEEAKLIGKYCFDYPEYDEEGIHRQLVVYDEDKNEFRNNLNYATARIGSICMFPTVGDEYFRELIRMIMEHHFGSYRDYCWKCGAKLSENDIHPGGGGRYAMKCPDCPEYWIENHCSNIGGGPRHVNCGHHAIVKRPDNYYEHNLPGRDKEGKIILKNGEMVFSSRIVMCPICGSSEIPHQNNGNKNKAQTEYDRVRQGF